MLAVGAETRASRGAHAARAPPPPRALQVTVREPKPTPGFLLEVASALRCAAGKGVVGGCERDCKGELEGRGWARALPHLTLHGILIFPLAPQLNPSAMPCHPVPP